jgi:hypothetical protein
MIHKMWIANPTPARMMATMSSTRISPMAWPYPSAALGKRPTMPEPDSRRLTSPFAKLVH